MAYIGAFYLSITRTLFFSKNTQISSKNTQISSENTHL